MNLTLPQFLAELKTANCHMSVESGVVTFENGDTFDANSALVEYEQENATAMLHW